MNLFHTTTFEAAREIDRYGFRELQRPGSSGGVFFADRPLGRADIGPLAAVIFKISLPSGELERFSARSVENEHEPASREYLIPVDLANSAARGRLAVADRLAAFEPNEPEVDGHTGDASRSDGAAGSER